MIDLLFKQVCCVMTLYLFLSYHPRHLLTTLTTIILFYDAHFRFHQLREFTLAIPCYHRHTQTVLLEHGPKSVSAVQSPYVWIYYSLLDFHTNKFAPHHLLLTLHHRRRSSSLCQQFRNVSPILASNPLVICSFPIV